MCIYKYNGNAENIVIPRKYDGHEIIVLNDDAFAGHTEIKSVSMPDKQKEDELKLFLMELAGRR